MNGCRATHGLIRVALVLTLGAAVGLLLPSFGSAATHVPNSISQDTTWTRDGSPYILDTDVLVSSTLTIQPGVVVKLASGVEVTFMGSSAALHAVGVPSERIYITSLSDDSVGGDDGGDGATAGAPGQWKSLLLRGLVRR
jgi:hypothetical protein